MESDGQKFDRGRESVAVERIPPDANRIPHKVAADSIRILRFALNSYELGGLMES